MEDLKIVLWDRKSSFNGVDIQILKDNLPNPCYLVYYKGDVVGAEDGNYRNPDEIMKLYENVGREIPYEKTLEGKVQLLEDRDLQIQEENANLLLEVMDKEIRLAQAEMDVANLLLILGGM